MGITPTPAPGTFPAGAQCNQCTLVTPLFAPGATPLNTVITIHGWNGGTKVQALTQNTPCSWTFQDANWAFAWWVWEVATGRTIVLVQERLFGSLETRFSFSALPPCQTNVSNTFVGVTKKGTWAELNW